MNPGDKVKLAILGGLPKFPQPLHVGRPNVGDRQRFLERTGQVLDSLWLTNNGPMVQQFEKRIAEYVGVKHCVCFCNATIGLELAVRALDLVGEVIVPSYTFIATVHSLQWNEITPVFADVDAETHNLDPTRIERHITPKTTAILATHVWGRPSPVDALTEIAQRFGLKLLFDAAHAFGCSYQGRMIGGFGALEVFSFHATKFLNSFEGGAIVTNNDDLAAKLRLMTNFGFAGYDKVEQLGTNGKMTEVCAAMGLTNLECMDAFVAVNRRNFDSYADRLKGIPGLRMLDFDSLERNNYQYVVVEVDHEESGLTRDMLIQVLHAENILARKYFWPGCHRMEPYRTLYPYAEMTLPETEEVASKVLVLPTGTAIGVQEIEVICNVLSESIERREEIARRLANNFDLENQAK